MLNNNDFQKAIALINKSSSILLLTHVRPDGDACGGIVAIEEALITLGKNVKSIFLSEIPKWYKFLFSEKISELGKDVTVEELIEGRFFQPDLIVIVDTNSFNQLPQIDKFLEHTKSKVLVIDHHVTSDGLGDVELIDTSAAASGLIVHDLFKYASWHITEKIAQAIFVAVATDTGWFQFNNTDSRVLKNCAELIDKGVNPTQVYHELYQNFSLSRFRLMRAMINNLELHLKDRYATQHLLQRDFKKCGAKYNDTENLIDECRRIASVQAAALFIETPDDKVRCSLRSMGVIDVRKIAQKFGGGGHKMAAGVHLLMPLEEAKKLIFEEVEKQFENIQK